MKKSIIAAGAASVALAAMPIVGVFADSTDSVTDNIQVSVTASCTFTAGKDAESRTYAASGTNAAGLVTPSNSGSGVHSFTVFCNDNGGYTVSATAQNLTDSNVSGDMFAYATSLPTSTSQDADKKDGKWNATIAEGTGLTAAEINQISAASTATTIVDHDAASVAGGETFTATYAAWIGTETPAGTYTGTIAYTLTPGA